MQALGLPGCSLYSSSEVVLLTSTGGTGVAAGYAAFDLPIPLAASGPRALYAQWLSLDPTAPRLAGLSDALLWKAP